MSAPRPTRFVSPWAHRADALPGLTIVLPCLDEEENLAEAVRSAHAVASRCALDHEIVIVDDGSTDQTADIAGALADADPRVRLVVHSRNHGYGEALRSGIAAARMPWVLLTDADLQYDIGELADFLPETAAADLVVGRRIAAQSTVARRAADAAWAQLIHALLRLPAHDVDCAFRLGRRDLLAQLELRTSGALAGAELLVKSQAAGARIVELPVHHRMRVAGRRSGTGRRLTARTVSELVALRRSARHAP